MEEKEIDNQIKIAALLTRKMLDSLTKEDEEALEEWEKSPLNKELEKEIVNYDSFISWKNYVEKNDISDQWESFLNRMDHSSKKSSKVIRLKILKWAGSIAAAVVLSFCVYHFYPTSNSSSVVIDSETIDKVSIVPGASQAVLVMANGQEYKLNSGSKNVISNNGISARNTGGSLQYNDSTANVKPQMNTLKVPRGGEYQLVLADGTKVWLNSETEIAFSVPFDKHQRHVFLKGEAYFDVAHDKQRPFIVSTKQQDVEVLGTEFNIRAYSDKKSTITTLVEGKIKTDLDLLSKDHKVEVLLPNQQLIFDTDNLKSVKHHVDPYPFTAWKNGRFVFRNETLTDFFQTLERWYDVEIFIQDSSLKNIRYTGDLPRYKNLESILKLIEIEMGVKIKYDGEKKIYITRK